MKEKLSKKALASLIALTTASYLAACSDNRNAEDADSTTSESQTSESTANNASTENNDANNADTDSSETKGTSDNLGEQLEPESANAARGFTVSNNPDAELTKTIYFDFACPDCYNTEYLISDSVSAGIKDGTLELTLVPIPFLDGRTVDNYSSRASSAFITVAENEPEYAYEFYHNLYDPEFFPSVGSGHRETTADELVQVAKDSGVSDEVAEKIYENHYYEWVQESVGFAEEDQILFPEGSAITPTIVDNAVYDKDGKLTKTENMNISH